MSNAQPRPLSSPEVAKAKRRRRWQVLVDGGLWLMPLLLWLVREGVQDPALAAGLSVALAAGACGYVILAKLPWSFAAKLALIAGGVGVIAATPAIDPVRLYPFLASATFLGLFIAAKRSGDNILYRFGAAFIGKALPARQMRALQAALDIWLIALSVNTLILAVLLVRFSFTTWLWYAQVYSYGLLAIAMAITVIKVALASPVAGDGTSFSHRVKAVSLQALGFLLFGLMGLSGMVVLTLLSPLRLIAPKTLEVIAQKLVHFGFSFAVGYWQAIGLMTLSVHHKERGEGARLLIANHLSMADVLTIISLLPRCYTFANAKYLRYAHLRALIMGAGYIPVDPSRLDSRVAALAAARQLLKEGKKLVIFPEGTRSLDGSLGQWNRGVFQIAIEEGIPITPVFFTTDGPLLTKSSWFYFAPQPVKMQVHFMPAVVTAGFGGGEQSLRKRSAALAEHCRQQYLAWSRADFCLAWNRRP